MQARLTRKPEHEVIAAIQMLDLESVKARVMDAELGEGWSREYAERIETAYKQYLTMLVKYQDHAEDIMLSKDVDEFWHTHILQTQKYMQDCDRVFGTYLHHNPHVGERTAADLARREAMAAKTRALYEREFGDERSAAAHWSGAAIGAAAASIAQPRAAYSAAAIHPRQAAYSAASIRPDGAAYSAASITAGTAAYSAASIAARDAAYSAAAIGAAAAAYSAASIRQDAAAYSAASISAQGAAYSAAGIEAKGAAYSAASIEPARAAYSAATLAR